METEDLSQSNSAREPGDELSRLTSVGGAELQILSEEDNSLKTTKGQTHMHQRE